MKALLFLVLALGLVAPAPARIHRSRAAVNAFKRTHPCPANGSTKGACPGYIVDHRVALCVGGPDTPDNMRWQREDLAAEKDAWECLSGWQQRLQECERAGCYAE